jgi:hypothetical protein
MVKFDVNGNPLDEYNDTTINMIRKFTIGADKITGYRRLVGHEVEHEAFSGPRLCYTSDSNNDGSQPFTTFDGNSVPTIPQRSVTPVSTTNSKCLLQSFPDSAWDATLTGTFDHSTKAPTSFGYLSVVRDCLQCVDGPQTPKYQQPPLEIWNKLRFWFNDDVRLSIASVSIPFGQRFVTIDLARQDMLAFEFPGLYVKQTIRSGTGTVFNQSVSYRPWISPGTLTDITLSRVELYVNNLFVNPEVHDIFIKRIGFSLIRVYRYQRAPTNNAEHDEQLLSQLKWPIEYMFAGLRPSWNISSTNRQQWRDWHRMTKINDVVYADTRKTEMYTTGGVTNISLTSDVVPYQIARALPTVDSLTLTAHGISIHDNFSSTFFNAYNPFHYGGPAIITPNDEGALMINFALYPKSYQPSGHLNVSRAREFFLHWTTRYTGSATQAELLVVAVAINFLLITDGSAVLRYST